MYDRFQPAPVHRGMIRGWRNPLTGSEAHVAFDPSKATDDANYRACLIELHQQLRQLDGGMPRSDRSIQDYIDQYRIEKVDGA